MIYTKYMAKAEITNDDIMTMLSQFAERVDQRFELIDQRFESIDQRFQMIDHRFESQEQFNVKLMNKFNKLDGRLTRVEETMATKDDIHRIENSLDGYASKIDTYAMEMAAMQHKIDRLEKYIQVIAQKTGVDLDKIYI